MKFKRTLQTSRQNLDTLVSEILSLPAPDPRVSADEKPPGPRAKPIPIWMPDEEKWEADE